MEKTKCLTWDTINLMQLDHDEEFLPSLAGGVRVTSTSAIYISSHFFRMPSSAAQILRCIFIPNVDN